ncbi:MAG: hypothetical protein ACRC3B_13295 [Bacteroidia bacterium]
MTWKRRILLYAFGFGLGVLVLYIAYGDRVLDGWTPASRVRSLLANPRTFDADSTALCKLNCVGVTLDQLRASIPAADVDLSRSNVKNEAPCHEYLLNCPVNGKNVEAYFSACPKDSTIRLLKVSAPENCKCN